MFRGQSNAFSPLHSFQTACLFLRRFILHCFCSFPLSLSGCKVSGGSSSLTSAPCPLLGGGEVRTALSVCGGDTWLSPSGCLKPTALCRLNNKQSPSLEKQFPGFGDKKRQGGGWSLLEPHLERLRAGLCSRGGGCSPCCPGPGLCQAGTCCRCAASIWCDGCLGALRARSARPPDLPANPF